MPVVFFLTPLSMVGGIFNTVGMLPDWLRWLAWANPFFYFINGIRGSMVGFDETPPGLGVGLTLLLLVVLGLTVWRLYAKGYGLRE
jgi:ABC-2 type transport system permease protein